MTVFCVIPAALSTDHFMIVIELFYGSNTSELCRVRLFGYCHWERQYPKGLNGREYTSVLLKCPRARCWSMTSLQSAAMIMTKNVCAFNLAQWVDLRIHVHMWYCKTLDTSVTKWYTNLNVTVRLHFSLCHMCCYILFFNNTPQTVPVPVLLHHIPVHTLDSTR